MSIITRIKRLLVNLILLFVSIGVTLVLFEIYLRTAHPEHFLRNYAYFDNNSGVYRLMPNKETRVKYPEFEYVLKVNSKGLRDYEYAYDKNKDTFRTIFLGDSFTLGHGVELKDSFVKKLEAGLRKKLSPKRIEAITLGMAGYGTDDCYKILINEGYKYHPDLVIYAFSITDFYDTLSKTKIKKNGNNIDEIKPAAGNPVVSSINPKKILQKSYLYHFLLNNMKKLSIIRNYLYSKGLSKASGPLYYLEDYTQFEYSNDSKNAVTMSFDYISKMDSYCRNMGARLMVVYLPDYFQSYYKILQSDGGSSIDKQYDMNKPSRIISEFCGAKHILYIDTLPYFQQKAKSQRLYYDSDWHFTKDGNRLVAGIIEDELLKIGIIR